ncbi:biopolymer transporter ExbD [Methylophaga nitratireducenticrescens]|uniref:Biopolymer transport protein ExbD/TolR n=1 Tax=Methylophaga nitratireducenticrescens TaxID=754476 RepID=I1XML8_METNJ|nr:biopolymer transporter ExbD [Methylophaga nitratireducenticrescens]AFI85637.1 biopolymer transporter ExbD [Methylophaga nitratireducenticrescens]AUZ85366.1 biopolymer transporter ExbD [Methylophaga nitratireducenticrescens]
MIGGFSDHTGEQELPENHDINVTPFIDVMLVLLIIFMVAVPLATASIPIDLPTTSVQPPSVEQKPIYLSVKADMTLTVNDKDRLTLDTLEQQLLRFVPDHETRIFLRADKRLTYEELMQVITALGTAGYMRIALVGLEKTSGA